MLLGAVLSDTVILNSPTTTERDHAVVAYLERALDVDALELGREMFEATADVSEVSAEEIVSRDAKQYQVRRRPDDLHRPGRGRRPWPARAQAGAARGAALEKERRELTLYALMVTDVLEHGTELLIAGDVSRGGTDLRGRGRRFDDRPARRDEPQEGGCAEADDRAVSAAPSDAGARRAGASPQSCSRR